ncbi:hypothetical protein [Clostridium saccharoperbutylacetonicum]
MMEFKFYMKNEPSEELINEFHKSMAESLVAKFGEATMKEVLKQIKEIDRKKVSN